MQEEQMIVAEQEELAVVDGEAAELFEGEGTEEEPGAEAEGLPQLQAEFRRLSAPLAAFTKLKASDPRSLERLDAALKRLPAGEMLGQAVEDLRTRTANYAQQARRERIAAFRPIEAEYVRAAREAGKGLRERSNGWRIDELELQLQREQARARFFYNREALTPWSPIGVPDDLAALEEKARGLLEHVAWPEEMLIAVCWDAYELERAARQRAGHRRAEAVPLPDYYRSLRVALVRYELTGQGGEKKLRWAELPRWAFLYNLDRYRALGTAVPEERRLGFQTGSQQESRQFGMVVNGLDPLQDYKTMCFMVPFGGGRGGS